MSERADGGERMDGPGELETWADKAAIQELVTRYCDAATRRDWDAFEALFTPSAVLSIGNPAPMRFEGARCIRDEMRRMVDGKDFLVQVSFGTIVELDGADRAKGRTTIQEITRGEGLEGLLVVGIYFDEFSKEDGVWRFTDRRMEFVYLDQTPLPGHAMIAPPVSS